MAIYKVGGNEAKKVKWIVTPYVLGRCVDLGCGPFKLHPYMIGVDNTPGWRQLGVDIFADAQKLDLFGTESMDSVFSSHVLEEFEDTEAVLAEWWRLVKPGGHLILHLPHKDLYPKMGEKGANKEHKHDFVPEDILQAMRASCKGWNCLVNEVRDGEREYSFLQIYKKRNKSDPEEEEFWKRRIGKKTLLIIRYGIIGDVIMAASTLPHLKAQGWEYITWLTTPISKRVLSNNPHIDEFLITDLEQVPRMEISDFWEAQIPRYTRVLNLGHVIETTLIAAFNGVSRHWPNDIRSKLMDHNYLETMHAVADVPFVPTKGFFPTDEERVQAQAVREQMPGKVILWTIAGSSAHKKWPHTLEALNALLESRPDVSVVTVGDDYWIPEIAEFKHPRHHHKGGDDGWDIRHSLAFAECAADLVVGPETGLMNSVAFLDVPKVIWLSHSSEHNLTEGWVRTKVLKPENTPCYPCHTLHSGFGSCLIDEKTKWPMCSSGIRVDAFLGAVAEMLWKVN